MDWYLAKLWDYFGLLGISSTVLGAIALLVLLVAWLVRWRPMLLAGGLVLALLAGWLGQVNSDRIAMFMPDTSDQEARLAEMRAQQARQALAETRSKPVGYGARQFAESDQATRRTLDQAGQEEKNVYEGPAEQQAVPAWQAGGKKQRDPDAVIEDETLDSISQAEGDNHGYRILPEQDVYRADRWDRINRAWLTWVFRAGLIMLPIAALLYLRRLNRPFGTPWPLPLDAPWLRKLFPPDRNTWLKQDTTDAAAAWLRYVVGSGKTFLYFGPSDPLAEQTLRRIPRIGPRLDKHIWAGRDDQPDARFLLDMLWFNRAAVVVTDPEAVKALLDAMIPYLEHRAACRAQARQMIHLVWQLDKPPSAAMVVRMKRLLAPTNISLDILSGSEPSGPLAEVLSDSRPVEVPAAAVAQPG